MAKKNFKPSATESLKKAAIKPEPAEPAVKMTNTMAFTALNYILVAVGVVVVVIGFLLMGGSASNTEAYDPDIFSPLRIQVAPAVTLFGFVFIIFGIVFSMPKMLKKNQPAASEE